MDSKIILGTVQMGLEYGINNTTGKPSTEKSFQILQEAFDNGIRTLDTAVSYGNANSIIGQFHRLNPDKKFKIISKIKSFHNSDIFKWIDLYFDELDVSSFHGLLFHSYNSYATHLNYLNILKEFQLAKKIKYLGVSIYSNSEFEHVLNDNRIDLIQLPFNLLDNYTIRGELIERAKNERKIIHTRSVFLQGLFFKNVDDQHKAVKNLRSQLMIIHDIANSYALTVEALALNYCLSQKSIDGIIIGVDSLDQLRSNISNIGLKLPEEIFSKIDKIVTNDLNFLNPSLWE